MAGQRDDNGRCMHRGPRAGSGGVFAYPPGNGTTSERSNARRDMGKGVVGKRRVEVRRLAGIPLPHRGSLLTAGSLGTSVCSGSRTGGGCAGSFRRPSEPIARSGVPHRLAQSSPSVRPSSRMFREEDVGRFLFHYTTVEAFLGHILPARRLRFSPMSEVNDPRESKDWLCSLTGELAGADDLDIRELSRRFTDALKGSAKVLCLTRDDPNPDLSSVGHVYARGYAHPRMWDRYSGHHTGVCLAFDIDRLGDEIAASVADKGELIHQGISYSDAPPKEANAFNIQASAIGRMGLEGALKAHRQRYFGTLYFYKSTDWASEFEYRWVLLSEHEGRYEYVDVRQSLAGVVFGPDYPLDSIPMVRHVLADESVEMAQLQYRNGLPIPWPVLR